MQYAVRHRARGNAGVTLFEVLVASAILAMIATMIYTAFSFTSHSRQRLVERQERDHLARVAMERISRDLRCAFLSAHVNPQQNLIATMTSFVGKDQSPGDRLDFTAFSHRRLMRNVHEGDSAEVGYRLEARRGNESGTYDLLRRESPRIDNDPLKGGVLDVLVPDVRTFNVRYYDPLTDKWIDSWDTQQGLEQAGRLPSRVKITLTMRESTGGERRYSTETPLMITDVLRFGLPITYHW